MPRRPADRPARRPAAPGRTARRRAVRLAATVAVLAAGFAAGRWAAPLPAAPAFAQDGVDAAVLARTKEGYDALRRAQTALIQSGAYVPAASGVNCFVTLAGGYDVLGSLQNGRGVDPETYCALEAGFAVEGVLLDLGRSADGRLTYRDAVVRLLPQDVLRSMYLRRAATLGEAL